MVACKVQQTTQQQVPAPAHKLKQTILNSKTLCFMQYVSTSDIFHDKACLITVPIRHALPLCPVHTGTRHVAFNTSIQHW